MLISGQTFDFNNNHYWKGDGKVVGLSSSHVSSYVSYLRETQRIISQPISTFGFILIFLIQGAVSAAESAYGRVAGVHMRRTVRQGPLRCVDQPGQFVRELSDAKRCFRVL